MNLLSSSAFCKSVKYDELNIIEITHPKFTAKICLQGAQILSFKPNKQADFLWLSDTVEYKKGRSLRGGIPICWPWFGVVDKNIEALTHFADRHYIIEKGKVVWDGTSSELQGDQDLQHRFLGV